MVNTVKCERCEREGLSFCPDCRPDLYKKEPKFKKLQTGDVAGTSVVTAVENCVEAFGWDKDAANHTGWRKRNIVPKHLVNGSHDAWFFLYTQNNGRTVKSGRFVAVIEEDHCFLVSDGPPPKWISDKAFVFEMTKDEIIKFTGEYDFKCEYDSEKECYAYTFTKVGETLV